MSRRYGRNQKRKYREQMENLEAAYSQVAELSRLSADRADRAIYKYEDLIKMIRNWWDGSVLVDPNIKDVEEFPPYYRSSLHKMQIPDFSNIDHTAIAEVELHYQTLDALEVAFEKDYGDRSIHVLLRVGNRSLKYYMDATALEVMGAPDYMKRVLWEELSQGIQKFWRN